MPSRGAMTVSPDKYSTIRTTYGAVFLVCTALFFHASYVTRYTPPFPHHLLTSNPDVSLPAQGAHDRTPNFPHLFIYRRTKKSGSSAMLDALLRVLLPYGYVPLYFTGAEMRAAVRGEAIRPFPRRLLVAEHNQITRGDDPLHTAVIADTVRDGYEHITSYCRYVKRVKTCDEALLKCMESEETRKQNRYRWAGREREDADTYIDLPLSSAHPALSTTILQRVFPNATLDIYSWNSANSKCPEVPVLREAYNRWYAPLEQQVEVLRKRMLVLAGYPFNVDPNATLDISLEDMLEAAEVKESLKYDIVDHGPGRFGYSQRHHELILSLQHWTRGENNSLVLTQRRK